MSNGHRIGITNAARILNVSVVDIKRAIFQNDGVLDGIKLPNVINLPGGNYQFALKDLIDLKNKMDNRSNLDNLEVSKKD